MPYTYPSRVIAHRGGGTLAPENTLAGLRYARQCGFFAVEFDVMLARHDVPVLMHDDMLERTTDGHGALPDSSAAELGRLDAGSWFDAGFAGEPVPGLEAAADLCLALDLFCNVEIKPWAPGGDAVAAQTGRIVAADCARLWRAAPARVLLSSFAPAALATAKQSAPHLARAALFDEVPLNWRDQLELQACVALHCNAKRLDPVTARAIKAAGYGLMCWTVDDPVRATELFDWGVDAVCTDRLDLFAGMAAVR